MAPRSIYYPQDPALRCLETPVNPNTRPGSLACTCQESETIPTHVSYLPKGQRRKKSQGHHVPAAPECICSEPVPEQLLVSLHRIPRMKDRRLLPLLLFSKTCLLAPDSEHEMFPSPCHSSSPEPNNLSSRDRHWGHGHCRPLTLDRCLRDRLVCSRMSGL